MTAPQKPSFLDTLLSSPEGAAAAATALTAACHRVAAGRKAQGKSSPQRPQQSQPQEKYITNPEGIQIPNQSARWFLQNKEALHAASGAFGAAVHPCETAAAAPGAVIGQAQQVLSLLTMQQALKKDELRSSISLRLLSFLRSTEHLNSMRAAAEALCVHVQDVEATLQHLTEVYVQFTAPQQKQQMWVPDRATYARTHWKKQQHGEDATYKEQLLFRQQLVGDRDKTLPSQLPHKAVSIKPNQELQQTKLNGFSSTTRGAVPAFSAGVAVATPPPVVEGVLCRVAPLLLSRDLPLLHATPLDTWTATAAGSKQMKRSVARAKPADQKPQQGPLHRVSFSQQQLDVSTLSTASVRRSTLQRRTFLCPRDIVTRLFSPTPPLTLGTPVSCYPRTAASHAACPPVPAAVKGFDTYVPSEEILLLRGLQQLLLVSSTFWREVQGGTFLAALRLLVLEVPRQLNLLSLLREHQRRLASPPAAPATLENEKVDTIASFPHNFRSSSTPVFVKQHHGHARMLQDRGSMGDTTGRIGLLGVTYRDCSPIMREARTEATVLLKLLEVYCFQCLSAPLLTCGAAVHAVAALLVHRGYARGGVARRQHRRRESLAEATARDGTAAHAHTDTKSYCKSVAPALDEAEGTLRSLRSLPIAEGDKQTAGHATDFAVGGAATEDLAPAQCAAVADAGGDGKTTAAHLLKFAAWGEWLLDVYFSCRQAAMRRLLARSNRTNYVSQNVALSPSIQAATTPGPQPLAPPPECPCCRQRRERFVRVNNATFPQVLRSDLFSPLSASQVSSAASTSDDAGASRLPHQTQQDEISNKEECCCTRVLHQIYAFDFTIAVFWMFCGRVRKQQQQQPMFSKIVATENEVVPQSAQKRLNGFSAGAAAALPDSIFTLAAACGGGGGNAAAHMKGKGKDEGKAEASVIGRERIREKTGVSSAAAVIGTRGTASREDKRMLSFFLTEVASAWLLEARGGEDTKVDYVPAEAAQAPSTWGGKSNSARGRKREKNEAVQREGKHSKMGCGVSPLLRAIELDEATSITSLGENMTREGKRQDHRAAGRFLPQRRRSTQQPREFETEQQHNFVREQHEHMHRVLQQVEMAILTLLLPSRKRRLAGGATTYASEEVQNCREKGATKDVSPIVEEGNEGGTRTRARHCDEEGIENILQQRCQNYWLEWFPLLLQDIDQQMDTQRMTGVFSTCYDVYCFWNEVTRRLRELTRTSGIVNEALPLLMLRLPVKNETAAPSRRAQLQQQEVRSDSVAFACDREAEIDTFLRVSLDAYITSTPVFYCSPSLERVSGPQTLDTKLLADVLSAGATAASEGATAATGSLTAVKEVVTASPGTAAAGLGGDTVAPPLATAAPIDAAAGSPGAVLPTGAAATPTGAAALSVESAASASGAAAAPAEAGTALGRAAAGLAGAAAAPAAESARRTCAPADAFDAVPTTVNSQMPKQFERRDQQEHEIGRSLVFFTPRVAVKQLLQRACFRLLQQHVQQRVRMLWTAEAPSPTSTSLETSNVFVRRPTLRWATSSSREGGDGRTRVPMSAAEELHAWSGSFEEIFFCLVRELVYLPLEEEEVKAAAAADSAIVTPRPQAVSPEVGEPAREERGSEAENHLEKLRTGGIRFLLALIAQQLRQELQRHVSGSELTDTQQQEQPVDLQTCCSLSGPLGAGSAALVSSPVELLRLRPALLWACKGRSLELLLRRHSAHQQEQGAEPSQETPGQGRVTTVESECCATTAAATIEKESFAAFLEARLNEDIDSIEPGAAAAALPATTSSPPVGMTESKATVQFRQHRWWWKASADEQHQQQEKPQGQQRRGGQQQNERHAELPPVLWCSQAFSPPSIAGEASFPGVTKQLQQLLRLGSAASYSACGALLWSRLSLLITRLYSAQQPRNFCFYHEEEPLQSWDSSQWPVEPSAAAVQLLWEMRQQARFLLAYVGESTPAASLLLYVFKAAAAAAITTTFRRKIYFHGCTDESLYAPALAATPITVDTAAAEGRTATVTKAAATTAQVDATATGTEIAKLSRRGPAATEAKGASETLVDAEKIANSVQMRNWCASTSDTLIAATGDCATARGPTGLGDSRSNEEAQGLLSEAEKGEEHHSVLHRKGSFLLLFDACCLALVLDGECPAWAIHLPYPGQRMLLHTEHQSYKQQKQQQQQHHEMHQKEQQKERGTEISYVPHENGELMATSQLATTVGVATAAEPAAAAPTTTAPPTTAPPPVAPETLATTTAATATAAAARTAGVETVSAPAAAVTAGNEDDLSREPRLFKGRRVVRHRAAALWRQISAHANSNAVLRDFVHEVVTRMTAEGKILKNSTARCEVVEEQQQQREIQQILLCSQQQQQPAKSLIEEPKERVSCESGNKSLELEEEELQRPYSKAEEQQQERDEQAARWLHGRTETGDLRRRSEQESQQGQNQVEARRSQREREKEAALDRTGEDMGDKLAQPERAPATPHHDMHKKLEIWLAFSGEALAAMLW